MALMMMFERGMKRRRTALAGLATALLLAAAPALRAESDHDQALRWLIYGNVLYKQGELKDAEKAYRDTRLAYLNLIGAYLSAAAQMNMAVGREVIP